MAMYLATRRPSNDSETSNSSDSSDDDAPLASLVQPRRPGSATSNASGRSLPAKPLIDIKSLSNSPLSGSPVVSNPPPPVGLANPTSLRNDSRSPTNINERLSSLTQSLARPRQTPTVVAEPTVKTVGDKVSPVITGRTAPSRSMTAPNLVTPSAEKKSRPIDEDGPPAPKSPTHSTPSGPAAVTPPVNTTESPPIRDHRTSLSLDDPTPIKPTPIHHRVPQSGFSVMSRPHYSTPGSPVSTVPSINSVQKQTNEGEPLDAIGDFTAAMFSQLDLDFSLDEDRGSLDSVVTKGATTTTITKSTAASSTVSFPAPGPTTRIANPLSKVGRKGPATSTRPVLSDGSPPPPPASTSESTTLPGRPVGRPRSSTLTMLTPSQPPKPSNDQPQPRPVPRSQPPKPIKNGILNVPAPQKAGRPENTTTPQTHPPPTVSRHKRVPSTTSTSSDSSYESSSSAPSIAPKKQKQPQPQLRPQQVTPRLRSSTTSTPASTVPPSPTKSLANNSSSAALNRPPQRPFAMRDNSPSSSTGDSSSGRLPVTPRDGSEIWSDLGRGVRGKQQTFRATELSGTGNDGLLSVSNSEMGLKAKKLAHRKSASYDDSTLKGAMRGGSGVAGMTDEGRRRERRRSEARNAIEV